ncbi:hypothetical protein ACFPOE_23880 [Caenimonas terrae]|uniref:Lipoprotein n=1 Tax=Caenimonas terrae TaxID=696074 RepID=A0ABW0NNY7_9BURK
MPSPTAMRCRWGLLPLLALLGACSTVTKVERVGPDLPARAGACHVDVVGAGSRDVAAYRVVAKIESHIQRNVFFGGRVSLRDDAHAELRAKACALGGDVVRVDDSVESGAAEMSDVHVWATVFKKAK